MFYNVSFRWSDSVFCSNIASADSADDVRAYYGAKYTHVTVTECSAREVESARERGKPVRVIRPQPVEIQPAEAPAQTQTAEPAEDPAQAQPEAPAEDPAPQAFQVGDVVEIAGAYFKTKNGFYFVKSVDATRDGYTLQPVGKSGKVRQGCEFWPLSSYVSDPVKRSAARAHDRENARITPAPQIPRGEIAQHFRSLAAQAREQAEKDLYDGWQNDADRQNARAAEFDAVADRLGAPQTLPEPAEAPALRIYWNGLRVHGGDLIPCRFYAHPDNDEITITGRNYERLPREFFDVRNDSDPYTDYFDSDRADVAPSHPLYRYVAYALKKALAHDYKTDAASCDRSASKTRAPGLRAQLAHRAQEARDKLAALDLGTDPGQPTAEDLAAVEAMKTAEENAKKEREHAEELARREKYLAERAEGRRYCESVAEAHPIEDGAPVVRIPWTESAALASLTVPDEGSPVVLPDLGQPLPLSVAAAEIIFSHFDKLRATEGRGYDKTDFIIEYTDPATGELSTYSGRYDLGDNDGGLIAHLRGYADHLETIKPDIYDDANACREEIARIRKLADYLEGFTASGRVISVDFAPGFREALQAIADRKKARRDAARETLAAVEQMTPDELAAAVALCDPSTDDGRAVAAVFFRALDKLDHARAVALFADWIRGGSEGGAAHA